MSRILLVEDATARVSLSAGLRIGYGREVQHEGRGLCCRLAVR